MSTDYPKFLHEASVPELKNKLESLVASSDSHSFVELEQFLLNRISDTILKQELPRWATWALLAKGPKGVNSLISVLPNAPGSIYPSAILEGLWHASQGTLPYLMQPGHSMLEPLKGLDISPETKKAAQVALDDLVVESTSNDRIFSPLMQLLYQESFSTAFGTGNAEVFRHRVIEVFSQTNIKLTERLVEQFSFLVHEKKREENYQRFLMKHPVLLDPLSTEVIPKQKLGGEYVTDFVVRRLDNKYILVEIEKPQDPIFTKADNFTSEFSHSFGQVLDFQQWIDSHNEYANHIMPGISSPRGLLVIGSKIGLTQRQLEKLHRFNINSNHIDVMTYDDLIIQAKMLIKNMFGRAISKID